MPSNAFPKHAFPKHAFPKTSIKYTALKETLYEQANSETLYIDSVWKMEQSVAKFAPELLDAGMMVELKELMTMCESHM